MLDPSSFILACGVTEMMVASLVMSAVGAGVSHRGQRQAAKNQRAYQRHTADLQRQAAQRKQSAVIAQDIQNREAVARQREEVAKQSAKARADVTLAAGAAGVTGLSVQHLYSEIGAQESSYIYALDAEQKMRTREVNRTLEDIGLGLVQQQYATMTPVQDPNAFAAALSWGAGAAKTAAKMYEHSGTQGLDTSYDGYYTSSGTPMSKDELKAEFG